MTMRMMCRGLLAACLIAGGAVVCSAQTVQVTPLAKDGRILVTLGQSDGRAVIEVRDSGPGIPIEIRDRVFEPFFTTKARGGGLGLPIARRTAELHGGTLSCDCPADGGTIVTLTLPVEPARARAESA